MPRTFTAAQIANKNSLEARTPWVDLLELEITGAPTALRFVNNVDPLTFHGNTFERAGFRVPWLPENSQDRLQRVQAEVQNVTREVQALLEQYWAAGLAAWTVRLWKVLWSAPDDTPLDSAEVYEVLGAKTNLGPAVQFDMRPAGITGGRVVPGRGYTATGGFPNIPR
jgi:hypothetical protein